MPDDVLSPVYTRQTAAYAYRHMQHCVHFDAQYSHYSIIHPLSSQPLNAVGYTPILTSACSKDRHWREGRVLFTLGSHEASYGGAHRRASCPKAGELRRRGGVRTQVRVQAARDRHAPDLPDRTPRDGSITHIDLLNKDTEHAWAGAAAPRRTADLASPRKLYQISVPFPSVFLQRQNVCARFVLPCSGKLKAALNAHICSSH